MQEAANNVSTGIRCLVRCGFLERIQQQLEWTIGYEISHCLRHTPVVGKHLTRSIEPNLGLIIEENGDAFEEMIGNPQGLTLSAMLREIARMDAANSNRKRTVLTLRDRSDNSGKDLHPSINGRKLW